MRGYFLVDRGWMDDPLFSDPFSFAQAWLWLVEQAAYRPTIIHAGSRSIPLERGQLSYSLRHIAHAWRWNSHVRVQRFLYKLRDASRLEIEPDDRTGRLLITICKYAKIQRLEKEGVTGDETGIETAPETANGTQKKLKNPSGPMNQGNQARSTSEPRAREAAPNSEFESWFAEYPHRVKQPAALIAYRQARSIASASDLLLGLRRYVESKPPDQKPLNPDNWLKQQRWLDQPAPHTVNGSNGVRHDQRRRPSRDNLVAEFAAAAEDDSGLDSAVA